jgi:LysR family transcriptional regulator for metE and metH
MVITPVCERLREAAHTILGELARVEEDVARARAGCEAVLRLSTECYTCYHWLPPVLKTFRQEFPTVEPRIVASATRRPVRRLLEGRLDVAIVDSEVHDRRLHVAPLFQDELVAVVAPEHPWSERPFVVAEDFRTEHVIGYLLTPGQSTLFREVLIPAGVKPKQVSRVQLTEAIIELVKAGMGVGALARWAVAPHLEAGTLRAVRVTKRGVHRLWSAVTFRERWEEPYVRGFVELLAREAFPTRTGRNHRHPR